MIHKIKQEWLFYSYIFIGFVVLFCFFYADFKLAFHFPKPEKQVFTTDVNDGGKALLSASVVEGDIHFNNQGMFLRPGEKCLIKQHFEKSPNAKVTANPLFYKIPGIILNSIEIVRDDGKASYTQDNNFKGTEPLELTDVLKGAKSFDIIYKAEVVKNAEPKDYLILQRTNIEILSESQLPPIPEILYIYLCFLIALSVFWKIPSLRVYAPFAGFGVLALLIFQFKLFNTQYVSNQFFCWILLAGMWYVNVYIRKDLLPTAANLSFLFLLIVAFALRWVELGNVLSKQLDSDAYTYIMIVNKMKGLFDTDFREPFYMWLIKIFFKLFGGSPINLRLLTVLLSIILIWLTYLFALYVFHSYGVGLLAALMMGISRGFIYQNLRGLRLESYCLAVMLFLLCFFLIRNSKKWWMPIIFALTGGLVMLNQTSSTSFVYLILILAAVLYRWKPKIILFVFIIPMLIVLPHLLNNKKHFNDYFYSTNVHTKIFRNYEFAGQPGFPTKDEVISNGYAGKDVKPFEYIFGMHTFGEVVKRTFKGFKWVFVDKDIPFYLLNNNWIVYYSFIIGVIIALFVQWEIVLFLFILNIVTYFFAGTQLEIFDWRLVVHIAPLVFLLAALGIERGIVFLNNASTGSATRTSVDSVIGTLDSTAKIHKEHIEKKRK